MFQDLEIDLLSPVRTASGSHTTIRTPGAVEQIFLKVVRVTSENLFNQSYIFKTRICWPQTLRHLSPVQKGRMSKMRTVPSIEFVKTFDPSGLSIIPVTVSVWPLISVTTAFFLRSQTFTMLSMPALITWLASSLKHTEVTFKKKLLQARFSNNQTNLVGGVQTWQRLPTTPVPNFHLQFNVEIMRTEWVPFDGLNQ